MRRIRFVLVVGPVAAVFAGCPSRPVHPAGNPAEDAGVDAPAAFAARDSGEDARRDASEVERDAAVEAGSLDVGAPLVDPVWPARPALPVCRDAPPKGTPASWKACSARGQCVLMHRSCCAPCSEVGQCGYVGVSAAFEGAMRAAICGPSWVACPACASPREWGIYASCRQGACTAVDARADDVSACSADADCVARAGDCCEVCGGGGVYVALRADAAAGYAADVCGKTKCAPCQTPAPLPRAACNVKTRHCELR